MRLPNLQTGANLGKQIAAAVLLACWLLHLSAEAQFSALFGGNSASSSSSSSSSTSTSIIRLKANKLRRPEFCRENLPRKSDELPALVIVGRVKEVYLATGAQSAVLAGGAQNVSTANSGQSTFNEYKQPVAPPPPANFMSLATDPSNTNRALVSVGRVIKGNKQLAGTEILISGFNSTTSSPCPNYVKPNDTLIMLLRHETDRRYSIQGGNLLSMNLYNLDRINAIASDEPIKRRGPIEDILCEAHYCPYGRCAADERGQVACQCPDSCPLVPAPVCGSDNTTYTNECALIREGCRRQKPLFVTKEASC